MTKNSTKTAPWVESVKSRWFDLRGNENSLAYERAKLLHEVLFERLGGNEKQLHDFIVGILEEPKGKRPMKFIRFVHAYDKCRSAEDWRAVGGQGMVYLARLKGQDRRRVMRRVRESLGGRPGGLSQSTTRTILMGVLGNKGYRQLLLEPRVGATNVQTLRTQIAALERQVDVMRGFVLAVVCRDRSLKRLMTQEVRAIVGADIVERVCGK